MCFGFYDLAQSSRKGNHNTTYLTAIFHYLWLELNPYRMPSCQFGTSHIGISPISGSRLPVCLNSKSAPLSVFAVASSTPKAGRLVAASELLPTFPRWPLQSRTNRKRCHHLLCFPLSRRAQSASKQKSPPRTVGLAIMTMRGVSKLSGTMW